MITEKPVGVLDSGVGGISILKALVEFMPYENFMYFGDSANAPYGEKTREEIRSLTMNNVALLLERGCKAIVVACNTATAAAINELRETYPDIPMIGLEPALKPAVLHKENSRVIVMATPFTLKEQKFETLKNKYKDQAEIIICVCAGDIERNKIRADYGITYGMEIICGVNLSPGAGSRLMPLYWDARIFRLCAGQFRKWPDGM